MDERINDRVLSKVADINASRHTDLETLLAGLGSGSIAIALRRWRRRMEAADSGKARPAFGSFRVVSNRNSRFWK